MFTRAKEWLKTWKTSRARKHEPSLSNSMELLAAYRQREKDAVESARRAKLGRPSETGSLSVPQMPTGVEPARPVKGTGT
jgi:hypothetical protein